MLLFVGVGVGVGIVLLAVILYFARSTKEFPKNWSELKAEALYQYVGVLCFIEDYGLRKYNRVGNLAWKNSSKLSSRSQFGQIAKPIFHVNLIQFPLKSSVSI